MSSQQALDVLKTSYIEMYDAIENSRSESGATNCSVGLGVCSQAKGAPCTLYLQYDSWCAVVKNETVSGCSFMPLSSLGMLVLGGKWQDIAKGSAICYLPSPQIE